MTGGQEVAPDHISPAEACVRTSEVWTQPTAVSTPMSPQPPTEKGTPSQGPRHGVAGPWLGEGQAYDLAFCLLLTGDAIPAKKPPPSPSSFGHQDRKFSFEGTTGPAVMLPGHFGFESGGDWVVLTCLPSGKLPCVSEEEQTAGATGSAPQEVRKSGRD